MKRHCSLIVMASATLLMTVASMPTHANGLGGLGNTVGSLTRTVDNTVSGVTGTGTRTTASLGALGSGSVLSMDAKSQLLGGIKAKIRLLSHKELVKLCLSAGGGKHACGSGDRSKLLGLVDARLKLLGERRLASLCGSCGGNRNGGGSGGTGGGGINSSPVAGLSSHEVIAYKKRCSNVLQYPQTYDDDIVSICRLIRRQKA